MELLQQILTLLGSGLVALTIPLRIASISKPDGSCISISIVLLIVFFNQLSVFLSILGSYPINIGVW